MYNFIYIYILLDFQSKICFKQKYIYLTKIKFTLKFSIFFHFHIMKNDKKSPYVILISSIQTIEYFTKKLLSNIIPISFLSSSNLLVIYTPFLFLLFQMIYLCLLHF